MKILNLYAGIGGNRKLWGNEHEITAVEWDKEIAEIYKENFPNDKIIITDAHQYLLEHIQEFDFVWSSPPCPTHSDIRRMKVHAKVLAPIYPDMDLYQEIILLRHFTPKSTKWVVENVKPYYEPLVKPMVELMRHYFWTNFYVRKIGFEDNTIKITYVDKNDTRYGFNIRDYKIKSDKGRTILRNLVNPKIGQYLFNESKKGMKPLFNFNY